jgi:ectoine hydroxylase-related dioxygenase (phytanoyl-CoA dioxygenase family)
MFLQICERGFARLESAIPVPYVDMARARLDCLGTGDKLFAYLDLDRTDPLVSHYVKAALPVAKIAFGIRTQLLRAQLTETMPASTVPLRSWHRDLPVEAKTPLSITSIFYLDPLRGAGHTFVIPFGSHAPENLEHRAEQEVAVDASLGDCVFLSGSIWHSGSAPLAGFRRRAFILQFGYWWIKQQSSRQLESGSFEESIYGTKAPPGDLYITDR